MAVVTLAAAGVLAGATPAGADTTTRLHLTGVPTSHIDYPNHDFTETDTLWMGGQKVGDDLVYCTLARTHYDCLVGVTLEGGVLTGQFKVWPNTGGFHGAFVQGTGAYAGTTGTFTGRFRPHNRVALKLTLHN